MILRNIRWMRPDLITAVMLIIPLISSPAAASYKLGPGDVLEIAVFGLPEYNRKVTVNVDGDVSLPFVGEIRAAGMSLPELRAALADELERKGTVNDAQVTVELAEHRPFYISGDVAKPGAHPYRPGLTVRHAIAIAGGVDVMRYRSGNPMLLAPDIQSEHSAAWMELVKSQARLIGLKAELDGSETADFSLLTNAPIRKQLVTSFIDLERRNLKDRLAAHRSEIEFLRNAVARAKEQIAGFEASVTQQANVVRKQEETLGRVAGNVSKGITSQVRADEETRALAMLKNQHTDAQAKVAQARKELRDIERTLERAVEERQVRLTRAIQDTSIEVDKFRTQVSSSGEKLMITGQLKAQLRPGAPGPDLVVHRKTEDGRVALPATADTLIEPDDVLEITVKADLIAAH
jgi:polysaccharide export outer membrane protein